VGGVAGVETGVETGVDGCIGCEGDGGADWDGSCCDGGGVACTHPVIRNSNKIKIVDKTLMSATSIRMILTPSVYPEIFSATRVLVMTTCARLTAQALRDNSCLDGCCLKFGNYK